MVQFQVCVQALTPCSLFSGEQLLVTQTKPDPSGSGTITLQVYAMAVVCSPCKTFPYYKVVVTSGPTTMNNIFVNVQYCNKCGKRECFNVQGTPVSGSDPQQFMAQFAVCKPKKCSAIWITVTTS